MSSSRSIDLSLPSLLLLVAILATLAMATTWYLSAPPAAPTSAPEAASPSVSRPPTTVLGDQITAHVLANGFEVIVLEQPNTPIVASVLAVGAGGAHDPPDRRGLAHLYEHLQFSEAYMERMTELGAQYNAFTATTQTTYHANVHVEQLEALAWAEARRFIEHSVDPEEVADERSVVHAEWGIANDTFGDALWTNVFATAWPGHDFSSPVIGVRAEFDAITPADLEQFGARYYVPANTRWIVAGGVKSKEVIALAEKYFGWIPPGRPADPIPPSTHEHPLRDEGVPIVLASESERHSLAFVQTYDPKHDNALSIAIWALTDDRFGLPARLREEFGEGATLDLLFAQLPGSSVISIHAEVDPWPGVDAVRELVSAEISRLFDHPLSSSTDRRTRARVEAASLEIDHPAQLAILIAEKLVGKPVLDGREPREILADLSPEAVHAASSQCSARGSWIHFSPTSNAQSPVLPTEARSVTALPANPVEPGEPLSWPDHLPAEFPLEPNPEWILPLASKKLTVPLGPKGAGPFLDVVLLPEPTSDRVALWAQIDRGVGTDPLDAVGLAQIATAASVPDREFAHVAVESAPDDSLLKVLVAKHDLERGIELLARWLRDPTIESDRLEVAIEEVALTNDLDTLDFDTIGMAWLFEALLGDPRLAPIFAFQFDEDAITRDRAIEWWDETVTPHRTTLIIGGAFDEITLRELIAANFEGWNPEGGVEPPRTPLPQVERKLILVPRPGEHLQVAVGFRAPASAHPSRSLLEEWSWYLFDSIERAMRQERGFSYGPAAAYTPLDRAGVAWASFDVPEPALFEALGVLDDVLEEQLSPALYEGRQPDRAMQESYLAHERASLDQRLTLVLAEVREPTLLSREEFMRRKVPATAIARTARSVIDRDRMVWVITGPISRKTEDRLREVYSGVVIEKK